MTYNHTFDYVTCPHCDRWTDVMAPLPPYGSLSGNQMEVKCQECGKSFNVVTNVELTVLEPEEEE